MSYVPHKPHFELLEVLAAIAAYQDSKYVPGQGKRWGRAGAWCIVRQEVIRGWYARLFKRYERPAGEICRRTLQYSLAALRRLGHLTVTSRHEGDRRTNKLRLRPSLYQFTARGRQWISRRAGWVENPAAMLAAQKIAQSGFNPDPYSSTSLSRAVDKSIHSQGNGKGKTAALRRPVRSTVSRPVRRPSKAPSEGGRRPRQRARIASAPRKRSR